MNTPHGGDASPSTPRKKLPVNPSLAHLQKQAKRRVKQNPALKLAEVQRQVAREYGCKNWAELARMVETMSRGAKDLTPGPDFAPLPAAANRGDLDGVRRILATGDFTQHDLDLALSRATCGLSQFPERRPIGELLLEHGADPDGQFGGNYGPLVFAACEWVDPAGIQFLLDAGADVSFPPLSAKYGMLCPLAHVLGSYVRGRNEQKHRCIDLLLGHNAVVPPEVTPEVLAIHRGDTRQLGDLIAQDPTLLNRTFPDLPYGNIGLHGATLLHCAVEFGEIECVETLLSLWTRVKNAYADIKTPAEIIDGVGGQTAIYHAISSWRDANVPMLDFLLRRAGEWIDWNTRATFRLFGEIVSPPLTPLEYALRGVDEATAGPAKKRELELLRNADQRERLKEAIRRGDITETRRLLEEHPDFLAPDLWPVAIFQAKTLEITRLLLDRGLSPDECSAPRKPLHLAVYQCLPDIVELLVARGADVNLRNPLGETPLELLDAYEPRPVGDPDAARIRAALIAAGAQEDAYTFIRAGDCTRLQEMLAADPALARADSELGGPLFVAARSGRPEAVRLLLEAGADPDKVNSVGNTALWFAAQSPARPGENRIAVMKLLLDAGADINRRCEDGTTALHFAAWRGPAEVVEFLLTRGARAWMTDDKELTAADHAARSCSPDKDQIVRLFSEVRILDPLFRAAVAAIDAGDVEGLRDMLEKHPSLVRQRAEEEGWFAGAYFRHPTLLHFIANNPYRHKTMPPRILESTEALLDAGANVDAMTSTENARTTLGLVTSCEPARKDGLQIPLIDLLVRRGADPSRGLDPAIIHGEMEAVRRLRELGAKHTLMSAAALGETGILRVLLKAEPKSTTIESAAMAAAMHGRLESVETLHGAGVDIRQRSTSHPYAITLLHEAARNGHRDLAEWLIAHGADVTIRDSQFNGTPAGWAEHNGQSELAEWLRGLEKEADQKIDQEIVEAVRTGNLPVLKDHLDVHPDKLSLTGGPWNKPLLHNAAWEGHLEIVRELVQRGADINARCESDRACAIHFAAEPGHLEVVRFLLDAGSVIEAEDNDHQLNVLGWATSLGSYREEVARLLLSRGAKMSIWSAIALGDTETARALLTADPDLVNAKMSRNEYFRSPLHHAVSRNRPAMVRLLLEWGADPEVRDAMGLSVVGAGNAGTHPEILSLLGEKLGATNLHDALTLGRFDNAEALLAANPDCIRPGGAETRLFVYAVCRKNWPAAEWLLARGADINAIAEVYQCPATALHFAIECAPVERVQWLLDQGADTTIPDGIHHSDALGWAEFFDKPEIVGMIRTKR